jgi:hypothetical protein
MARSAEGEGEGDRVGTQPASAVWTTEQLCRRQNSGAEDRTRESGEVRGTLTRRFAATSPAKRARG